MNFNRKHFRIIAAALTELNERLNRGLANSHLEPETVRTLFDGTHIHESEVSELLRNVRRELRALEPAPAGVAISGELSWAVERWNAEVKNRPLVNIYRRTLDDTWRQVIRHFRGDPDALCGPGHDALFEQWALGVKERTVKITRGE